MAESQVFFPPKTKGIILHALLILFLLIGSGFFIYLAFSRPAGWSLILFLLASLILIALLPVAAYRGYALLHATYSLERNGLRVRWGLRSEDLPLPEVIWVRPAIDLEEPLRLPLFSLPGAIMGNINHADLGPLEFIASSVPHLVIVASVNKTLVLSPEDPEEFISKFQRFIEMGSLNPMPPHTAIPAAYIQEIFNKRLSRSLILINTGLTLLLMIITSLLITGRETVSLGFDIAGNPLSPVSSNNLLLIPVIAIVFTLLDLIGGVFFYRRPETRIISYFVWSAGSISALLMILGVVLLGLISV